VMPKTLTVDEAVSIVVERIVSAFSPDRIVLFGSQARDDAKPDSDFDFLVVLPTCDDRRAATVSMMRTVADLPISKDILVTTPQELETRGRLRSTVLYAAMKDGKTVYAR